MNVRQLVKRLLPPIVIDFARRYRRTPSDIERYERNGRVPWSPGYITYRRAFVSAVLDDPVVMATFRSGCALPHGYGTRLDERCIEFPWVLSHLLAEPRALLDAGSSLNHDFVLSRPGLAGSTIHVLTLDPDVERFQYGTVSYLLADLRDIPTRDEFYDVVVCLSTLEHVGFDNSWITGEAQHRERRPDDFLTVMNEFRRVLKPGGQMLFTVPFGVHEDLGTQQVFDQRLLMRAIDAFGPATDVRTATFRYTAPGWQTAPADECANCRYEPWIMLRPDQRPAKFPASDDGAAAARAVACVAIVK